MELQSDVTATPPLGVGASTASDGGLLGWWRVAAASSRRALIAASLGWALDAFDVMLFSLVLASVIADLGLTKSQAGALGRRAGINPNDPCAVYMRTGVRRRKSRGHRWRNKRQKEDR